MPVSTADEITLKVRTDGDCEDNRGVRAEFIEKWWD
ncbi:hypothetical protein Psal006b_01076 [Piscirickettsia salmonis]|uniref:Uncharacterized protein n=1 Tax=Piscirickettsia salmonis TaxID=1238 RepID=A0AAC8VIV7_PISSA|nr:hypothetical protein KU39_2127 [Piscirickettsia salmonis]QGN98092.1 hypothetical protein Psal006b_01076 [Piscirickettsia salmonis]QGO01707.1 hypothetical protein Psal008_01088 [Piscirickettsia salmonis]QGO12404.1 hypothetical protein Psal010b_01077 [Piscirickettsia salmonis]QGO19438.1 hypothetical protein Psal013_01082 [Piscirickettsia salmonis]